MRNSLLKISNYALYLSMCLTLSAGLILEYRLPTGPMNRGVQLLGFSRHDWSDIHVVCAISFFAVTFVHLILNWSWITKVAARGNRMIVFASVGLGVLLVLIPLLLPLQFVTVL